MKIAPSLLSADFANLASELKDIEKAGADLVHLVQSDKYAVIGLFGESAISSHCLEDTALIDTDLEILESQLTQCGGRCKDQFDLC